MFCISSEIQQNKQTFSTYILTNVFWYHEVDPTQIG